MIKEVLGLFLLFLVMGLLVSFQLTNSQVMPKEPASSSYAR